MWLHGWRKAYNNCLVLPISTRYIFFSVAQTIRTPHLSAWLGLVLGWGTFWEVSRKACDWGQSTLKRLMLVCGVSRQCLKSSSMLQVVSEQVGPVRSKSFFFLCMRQVCKYCRYLFRSIRWVWAKWGRSKMLQVWWNKTSRGIIGWKSSGVYDLCIIEGRRWDEIWWLTSSEWVSECISEGNYWYTTRRRSRVCNWFGTWYQSCIDGTVQDIFIRIGLVEEADGRAVGEEVVC